MLVDLLNGGVLVVDFGEEDGGQGGRFGGGGGDVLGEDGSIEGYACVEQRRCGRGGTHVKGRWCWYFRRRLVGALLSFLVECGYY